MTEIRTRYDEKRRQVIDVGDLLYAIAEYNSDSAGKVAFIEKIISVSEFADAFETVISGCSNEEYTSSGEGRSAEKLRLLCVKFADEAAKQVIQAMTERINYLANRLKDAKDFNAKLLEQWPDAFKKYVPKEQWTYSGECITDDQVTKMLEYVRETKN